MPTDYKNRALGKKKRKPVSPWLGLLAGLSVGLFVAFLVFIRMQAAQLQPTPVIEAEPHPAEAPREETPVVHEDTHAATPKPPETRFKFYDTLPEMKIEIPEIESVIPEKEIRGKAENGVKQVEQPGTYYLQVGSFRSREQADRFRAELTLQGFKTGIQEVTINNKETYHRVRVGPFQNPDELNHARQQLDKQGIESTLIRTTG